MKSIAAFQSPAELLVADEWRALRLDPRAVLLVGPPEQTSLAIATLLPAWPAPIEICLASSFTLDRAVRTLVLQDAGEMPAVRQAELIAWMDDPANDTRFITAVRRPLFASVKTGCFSSALYYRLNTITLDFSSA